MICWRPVDTLKVEYQQIWKQNTKLECVSFPKHSRKFANSLGARRYSSPKIQCQMIIFAFLIHIVSGFIFTNYFTQNMIYFPSNAGIAGGLIGGLLYIITSIISFLISSSGEIASTFDMSIRYLGVGIPLVLVIFYSTFLILKKQQKKAKITTVWSLNFKPN